MDKLGGWGMEGLGLLGLSSILFEVVIQLIGSSTRGAHVFQHYGIFYVPFTCLRIVSNGAYILIASDEQKSLVIYTYLFISSVFMATNTV